MVFLLWFLLPVGCYAIYAGIVLAFRRWKGRASYKKEDWIALSLDLVSALALTLLPTILVYCLFPRINLLSFSPFYLFVSFLCRFSKIHRLVLGKGIEKKELGRRRLLSLSLFALALLETFAFNFTSYSKGEALLCAGDGFSASLVASTKTEILDEGLEISSDGIFVIDKGEESYSNIAFDFSSAPSSTVNATFEFSTDLSEFSGEVDFDFNPAYANSNIFSIPSGYGGYRYIRITIDINDLRDVNPSSLLLTRISFDRPTELGFNLVRVGAISLIIVFCFYLTPMVKSYSKFEKGDPKKVYVGVLALTFLAAAVFMLFTLTDIDRYYVSYPLDQDTLNSMSRCSIYTRLFDAFQKGRLSLDVWVDPLLAELENPWDPAAWNSVGASVRWDHAYYQGAYYCYYGPAPVILFSYPIFWLSGCRYIPDILILQVLPTIFASGFFLLLLFELSRLMTGKINYLVVFSLFVFGFFTSMMMANVTYKKGGYYEGIYHAPIACALMCFDLFMFLTLIVYRRKKGRMLFFALSALSFVLLVASRPNLIFTILLAVPFYVSLIVKERKQEGRLWLSLIPGLCIVVIGATLLGAYNYLRFDSVFEFGQSYQMNYDQTKLDYAVNKVFPSFLHFFCQPLNFYDEFPFVSCSVLRLSFDDCPYLQGYVGILMIPFFLFLFLSGFVCDKKREKEKAAFLFIFPVLLFVLGFTTYSKAGVCARYLIEFYHFATIASSCVLMKLLDSTRGKSSQKTIMSVGFVSLVVSSFIGLNLLFDVFDGWYVGDLQGLPLYIKEAFFTLNCLG